MPAKDGRAYAIYLATSEPTAKDDSGDAAYDKVLLVTEHSLDESIEAINITTKDDGDDSAYVGARADRDVSFSALLDTSDDAGQAHVQTAISDGSTHDLWFLLTTDITGDLEWHAKSVPTSRSMSFPDGSPASFDVTLKVNGSLTEQTIS